ncbi:hypothetical protein ACFOYW_06035 [Gryllotalpicola reticulitermitis]|uniref:DNA mismatch repair proteins mutS family domain-containing protein n=1 Tax=Gryllotalpicola reticulitermitis TaxID=1184153 RepID=A0ABV8Q5Q3_9MICO
MSDPDLLYPAGTRPRDEEAAPTQPAHFADLNLDQVVTAVTAQRSDVDLTPIYWSPLSSLDALRYRQEVFEDLERQELGDLARTIASRRLNFHFHYQRKELREDDRGLMHHYRTRSFLNAADEYCVAVLDLCGRLERARPRSRALAELSGYLRSYVAAEPFRALHADTTQLQTALAEIHYAVLLRGNRLTVARYDGEADYGKRVASSFARFQVGGSSRAPDSDSSDWEDYASTGILDLIAQLYPEVFARLDEFCSKHQDYLDPVVARYDRDIQFYLAYLDYIAPIRAGGLSFSYPRLSDSDKTEQALDTFDLALAHSLLPRPERRHGLGVRASREPTPRRSEPELNRPRGVERVVVNDLSFDGPERILVVSGPNNGGKTTLARTLGQLHYLARLGCPVPGRETALFVCDQIFTHFERAEDSTTMTGRLQTELNELHADLAAATGASLIILNEIFNSTTSADALFLSREILARISDLDALCICVTFLDELASINHKTVSMVSLVDAADPAIRTHKVIRKPADGKAYAHAIADKYGLGYERLLAELTS